MNIFPRMKGGISDYNVIAIGHLSWNRYFKETRESSPRKGIAAACTCTLINGIDWNQKDYFLLIDPTIRESKEAFYFDLNRRTGLKPSDITHCFSTHHHYDHVRGLNYFQDAQWLAAKPVAEILKDSQEVDGSRIYGVEGEFLPGIFAVSLPGHTDTLHGIATMQEGKRILVASDIAMTWRHFKDGITEHSNVPEVAARTISNIKESFEIIIPGHDNLFHV